MATICLLDFLAISYLKLFLDAPAYCSVLETAKLFHTPDEKDHLKRHRTMKDYLAAKSRIFMNQGRGDYFVFNADDASVASLAGSCPA